MVARDRIRVRRRRANLLGAALAVAIFLFAVWAIGRAVDYELQPAAQAHLVVRTPEAASLAAIAKAQRANLAHARYVCRRGGGEHRRWACWASSSVIRANGQGWLRRELRDTMNRLRPAVSPSIARMIAAAEAVKAQSPGSDPWPSCPDPYDGGGYTWQDTKDCESPSTPWWADPPGYYCGPLQLDPVIWRSIIRRYGVPCNG